jgi:hypothetical protein
MPRFNTPAPHRTAEALADQIESQLLLGSSRSVSLDRVVDVLGATAYATPADASMALNHMRWRDEVLGEAYPFELGPVAVKRAAAVDATSPYVAMLLLSSATSPFRATTEGLAQAATVFERLVACATARLLGDGAESIRFGWPSDEGRPQDFPAAVVWLAARIGMQIGSSYRPPRRQDGGVDVVSWRKFPDGRPGFPILLTQATLERDVVMKSCDIDLRVWAGYLRFDIDPTTALAVPHVVPMGEAWKETASRTILLDRARIAWLLKSDSAPEPVSAWTSDQLTHEVRSVG